MNLVHRIGEYLKKKVTKKPASSSVTKSNKHKGGGSYRKGSDGKNTFLKKSERHFSYKDVLPSHVSKPS
jgi:hypothetical protein